MWWLDDDLLRDNSTDLARQFFQARLEGRTMEPARRPPRGRLELELTDAQHTANRRLREVGVTHDALVQQLRENARAFQKTAVRQGRLEAKLVQLRDRHRSNMKQYAGEAKKSVQLLRQQLDQARERIDQQAGELQRLKGLRESLLAAEQNLAARDQELDQLRRDFDERTAQSAARFKQAQQLQQSEMAFLQSTANDVEQRCLKLQQENDQLRGFSKRLSATHQAQLQQSRRGYETSQLALQTQLEQANQEVASQKEEIEQLKTKVESLRNENEIQQRKVSSLAQTQQIADQTIRQLKQQGAKSNDSQSDLNRANEALKQARSDNERLRQLQSSQYRTLQGRVDALIAQLAEEKAKRPQAEKDAVQPCTEQAETREHSEEIEQVRRQRDSLLAEINQLRAKNSLSSYRLTQRLHCAQRELEELRRASGSGSGAPTPERVVKSDESDQAIEQHRRTA